MAMNRTKTGKPKTGNVGLVALGSLIGNLVQALRNEGLSQRNEQLANYANQLRAEWNALVVRYQSVAAQFDVLRQQNLSLWHHVQALNTALEQLRQQSERQRQEDANVILRLQSELAKARSPKP